MIGGGIGIPELMILLVIVLIIFGANKLPEIGSGMGRAIKNFKRASDEPEEIDVSSPKADKKEKNKDNKSEEKNKDNESGEESKD